VCGGGGSDCSGRPGGAQADCESGKQQYSIGGTGRGKHGPHLGGPLPRLPPGAHAAPLVHLEPGLLPCLRGRGEIRWRCHRHMPTERVASRVARHRLMMHVDSGAAAHVRVWERRGEGRKPSALSHWRRMPGLAGGGMTHEHGTDAGTRGRTEVLMSLNLVSNSGGCVARIFGGTTSPHGAWGARALPRMRARAARYGNRA